MRKMVEFYLFGFQENILAGLCNALTPAPGLRVLLLSSICRTESGQRPLLVLVDRNIDLATPLHHTWTYQALVHDVLVRE